MQGLMAMPNALPLQGANASGGTSLKEGLAELEGGEESAFASLFTQALQNGKGESFLANLEIDEQAVAEALQMLEGELDFDDSLWEELDVLFSELSMEDGFADLAWLESDGVQSLLESLPSDLSEEVKAWFASEEALENIASSDMSEHAQMIAALIAVNETTSGGQLEGDKTALMRNMEQSIQRLFPGYQHSEMKDEKSSQAMINRLNDHMNALRSQGVATKEDFQNLLQQNGNSDHMQMLKDVFARMNLDQERPTVPSQNTANPALSLDNMNQPMARAQQLAIHLGDQQAERPNQEQFIRQFQDILSRSHLQSSNQGTQQLSIKLYPESLGRLDVNLTHQNGVLVAQMMTTTGMAKEMIESQLNQLRQAFLAQNIQVDRIEVNQQQGQTHLKDATSDEQGNQQQREESKQDDSHQEGDDQGETGRFADYLEHTINTEA